jgi:hypothetical protein
MLSGFLLRNWAELGGRRTDKGAPSILAMSAREAFNWAYYLSVQFMKEEDRKEWDKNLNKTAPEWREEAAALIKIEEEERRRNIQRVAEVG